MKIKKFEQIVENNTFDTSDETMFVFYAKRIENNYIKIQNCYSIDESLKWYNENIKDSKVIYGVNTYEDVILVEEKTTYKILDIDMLTNSKKYNL